MHGCVYACMFVRDASCFGCLHIVYVCVCLCLCGSVVLACMHVCMYECTCVHVGWYAYVCVNAWVRACNACIYARMYACNTCNHVGVRCGAVPCVCFFVYVYMLHARAFWY